MIQSATLDYLKKLKKNNNKDWFNKNKHLFEAAKANFEEFIDLLILKISEFDNNVVSLRPKDCIFRIYRDVRFSKDKTPYKANFGAVIRAGGRKSGIAGYYMHLAADGSLLAGGMHMPSPPKLASIREDIVDNINELKKIIRASDYKKYFKEIWGDKVKTAPRGYPKDHPQIELLRFKDFLIKHEVDDQTVLSKKFPDYCSKVFKNMIPFNSFMNRATKNITA